MKKLSKLMALLLSLLMILSLFAACGDDKKDDDDKEDTSVSDEKDKDDKDEDEDEDEDDKKDKDDKKDEDEDEAVSAEDMLVGEWECEMVEDGVSIIMTFNFYDDNTVETSYTKDSYDDLVDVYVAEAMADVTDEEIEEEGFSSREEAEEFIREMMMEELPYEDFAAEFEMEGTWELDGDDLTVEIDGEPVTAETDLSDGGTSFTLVSEDGDEIELKKVK